MIKRELAVVRQKCNAANESLEKAQDTIRELQQQKVGNKGDVGKIHIQKAQTTIFRQRNARESIEL